MCTVTGVFSGLPVPAFNPIHVWQGAPSLAGDLAAVIERADAAGLTTQIVVPVGAEHEATVSPIGRRTTCRNVDVGDARRHRAVSNVAVPAPLRRRGLGAAATWEVVRRRRERGSSVTTLEASPLGEPVYGRMGFDTVANLRVHSRAQPC